MDYKFKEDFYWGAACSGPQTEGSAGKKCKSIWEHDFANQPEKYFDQVGNLTASNFYNNYQELIPLMKKAGIHSYRTSIQWSRIITDREGTIDPAGIAFYHNVLDELIKNGIEPMLCLFHFDMPMYWMEKGGFENRETAEAFGRYAELCFREYGEKVHYWSTFNEPIIIPEQSYLYEQHYPEVVDMKRAVAVAYHIQLASSLSIEAFRGCGCHGEIGIILNLTPTYPPENATAADRAACELSDLLFNRSFLDIAVNGTYPPELIDFLNKQNLMPKYRAEDLTLFQKQTVDYLGINYYSPRRMRARTTPWTKDYIMPETFMETYTYEGQKINPYRGWEIYEKAVYDIAINIRDNYGNIKWYLSENGMGVQDEERFIDENGQIADDYRITFIKEHLHWLHKGIQEGSNCFGYHLWAAFDCWSWRNAYKNRYGLIRVDIKNNCKLSIKKSGEWFKTLTQNHGFAEVEGGNQT